LRNSMAHVVTDKCDGCKFTDCVEVCPVACFYELENQVVIHPEECIDCMAGARHLRRARSSTGIHEGYRIQRHSSSSTERLWRRGNHSEKGSVAYGER